MAKGQSRKQTNRPGVDPGIKTMLANSVSQQVFVQPWQFNIIDVVAPDGTGAYSKMTLGQMSVKYPGVIIGDFDEWIEKKNQSFCHPPERISEERYMEMLEVLPPEGYKSTQEGTTFKLCERTCGSITAIYCRIGENYFGLSDKFTMKHEDIIAACRAV